MKKDTIAKIIIFIFLIFYLLMIDNLPVIGGDQPFYILLGKSLSIGQGYSEIWSIGNPAYTKFPFLFPVFLAPIIYFCGYNFFLMRLLLVFMAVGSLWIVYLLFKRFSDESTALIILILTGLSLQVFYYSYHILSEIPYFFFSLLALNFTEKFKFEKKWLSKTAVFTTLFILAAYFIRNIGISLIIASLIYLFFEREDKHNLLLPIKKVVFAGFSVSIPILLWLLRNYRIKQAGGFEYFWELFGRQNPFNPHEVWGWGEMIIHNIYAFVFYAFPRVLIGIQFSHRNFIAFLLTGIIFYGFLHCLVKKRTIAEYYAIFYMFILLLWSWSAMSGARFLVPIIPFVFYYFIVGIRKIIGTVKAGELMKKGFFIFLIALLLLFNIRESILFTIDKEKYEKCSKDKIKSFLDMAEWAKNNTAMNSTFGTIAPASVYLHFGRKAVRIPYTYSDSKVIECIYRSKVDYIVVDSVFIQTQEYLWPIITMNLDKFSEAYRKNDNVIYKVIENKEN